MSAEVLLGPVAGHAALALLSKLVPESLLVVDLERLTLVWSSRPLDAMLDLDPAEMAAIEREGLARLYHPADLADFAALRARYGSLGDGEVLTRDVRFRGRDGAWHWLHARALVFARDAAGRPTQLLASVQNVTQARRLAERRALAHAALQHADDAVIVTTPDAVIAYVNRGFERLSGYAADELIGRHVRALKSGRHDAGFYRALWQTLLQGEPWRGTFVNRRKDGAAYRVATTISPVRDQAGLVTHFVAVQREAGHDAVDARAAAPTPTAAASPAGARVWLVEDDPQVRALSLRVLQRLGFQASAFDGARAVLAAAQLARLPDLIVCDVGLPDLDGVALAREVRLRRPAQRFLFVSGRAAQDEEAAHLGSFLAKPFSLDELARAVRASLDGPTPPMEPDARSSAEL